MVADDVRGERQAKPRALRLAGEERLEDLAAELLGDSGAGVVHAQGHPSTGDDVRRNRQPPAAGHRLHGVPDEIQGGLLDLVRVDEGARTAMRQLRLDGDGGPPGLLAHQVCQLLDHGIQALMGGRRARRAGERQVLVGQVLQAFRFLLDRRDEGRGFGRALAPALRRLFLQQLRVQHDGTEGVAHFVRHVRRELGEGREALPALLAVAHTCLQRQFLARPGGLLLGGDPLGAIAHQTVARDKRRQRHQDEQEFIDRCRMEHGVRHEKRRGDDGKSHRGPERPCEGRLGKGGRRGLRPRKSGLRNQQCSL